MLSIIAESFAVAFMPVSGIAPGSGFVSARTADVSLPIEPAAVLVSPDE
jgi:hypothetical protein